MRAIDEIRAQHRTECVGFGECTTHPVPRVHFNIHTRAPVVIVGSEVIFPPGGYGDHAEALGEARRLATQQPQDAPGRAQCPRNDHGFTHHNSGPTQGRDGDTMNDEYTPEDFRSAGFAVLPKYGLRAHKSAGDVYWQRDGIKRATNAEMAEAGWQPVVVAEDPEADALEEEIQDLRDRLNAMVEENICRRSEAAPITLDTLREAWENAEVPTEGNPVRVGDALISSGRRGHLIRSAAAIEDGWAPPASYRVLHRAPQPEPWEGLAKVLRTTGVDGQAMDPEILASVLYERGLRLVGGDDRG